MRTLPINRFSPSLKIEAESIAASDFLVFLQNLSENNGSGNVMREHKINHVSGIILVMFSLIGLLAVLSGYFQPPQPDEGTAAHIFQLSLVALIPTTLLFLATAQWKQSLRSARLLAFSAATLVLAFGALFYLEHYR